MTTTPLTGERADLLETLTTHRQFLRHTTRGLSDADVARRTTASELCIGGLIKHVAITEESWMAFVLGGTDAMGGGDWTEHHAGFQMAPGDTLAAVLERYAEVASHTDELIATLPDLDLSHPLPEAPWFEPGARRSARRVLLHVIAETAQHAGHADILRESLDGAKTMG